ncbi:hypothetical protein C4J81_12090 [Deltaproteobacteria bacterium Smac51]|nr:hypothetical protein C4J81_12090 [Deltaproteobacteria bacterium Smac51]
MTGFQAEKILAKSVGELFLRSEHLRDDYVKLAARWHPDRNKDPLAGAVMAHINILYAEACRSAKSGRTGSGGSLQLETVERGRVMFNYLTSGVFELGQYYANADKVIYIIPEQYHQYVNNFRQIVSSFTYSTRDLKERIGRCMPGTLDSLRLNSGQYVLAVKKNRDALLMRDVINHYPNGIEPPHAAWMVSRLLMICVYLYHARLVSSGLTIDSCFVSPSLHAVFPLGSWWFACGEGQTVETVPAAIYDVLPTEMKDSGRADHVGDLESVKLMGRQMFKDPTGMRLRDRGGLHESLAIWLNSAADDDPVTEFESWHQCLKQAFGPRRFVEMRLDSEMVYGPSAN